MKLVADRIFHLGEHSSATPFEARKVSSSTSSSTAVESMSAIGEDHGVDLAGAPA